MTKKIVINSIENDDWLKSLPAGKSEKELTEKLMKQYAEKKAKADLTLERPFTLPESELPIDTSFMAIIGDTDLASAIQKFDEWCRSDKNGYERLLGARIE